MRFKVGDLVYHLTDETPGGLLDFGVIIKPDGFYWFIYYLISKEKCYSREDRIRKLENYLK